ncbi:hypothetical protein TNCV_2798841 [Trichonephila clavipes]|nr:hypothetical protein TNCV_2798841 [Trichonephila clavipes]
MSLEVELSLVASQNIPRTLKISCILLRKLTENETPYGFSLSRNSWNYPTHFEEEYANYWKPTDGADCTLPPNCLPELRSALLDEWCNIPQDQIDNLILSMSRRYNKVPDSHKSMETKLSEEVVAKIMPVYQRLASKEILLRCVSGKT